jgi:DNA-binding CsgD family transcriptional regulator
MDRTRDGLHLTPRQRQVVGFRLRRLGRREIAHRLGISPRAVRFHLDEARAGNGMSDEVELLLNAARESTPTAT